MIVRVIEGHSRCSCISQPLCDFLLVVAFNHSPEQFIFLDVYLDLLENDRSKTGSAIAV